MSSGSTYQSVPTSSSLQFSARPKFSRMSWVDITRIVIFAWAFFCGILAMALSADAISFTTGFYKETLNGNAMAVAVGVLTIVTIPPMLVVDFLRTGAFTSMILVELSWLGLLELLWLVAGALAAANVSNFFEGTCDWIPHSVGNACHETAATAAFSFLAFLPLLGYEILILTLAIIRHTRGAPIWTSSVKESFIGGINGSQTAGTTAPQFTEAKVIDSSAQHPYPPTATSTPTPPHGYPQV
ncbi:hypothetical protein CERSUDRAFT_80138 [Gelatoporia subvermispora B]|uniref:MARVEL domain-containing protein n=1 Tax=Ceriporiopsis subvermispora (strain B) TaxID=914234 RepID=M2RNQ9_CERS8|nr:hypothetical protein CERSUDRAFT_80138 [Gelatoporia subvermispora B]